MRSSLTADFRQLPNERFFSAVIDLSGTNTHEPKMSGSVDIARVGNCFFNTYALNGFCYVYGDFFKKYFTHDRR
jgi:hypothetical protein